MVNSQAFAKRLQIIIDYYGISATVFSEQIEFNRSTISHLLSGRNKPSLEFILKVLEQFPEVELYWLINGKGSFPSEGSQTSEMKITKHDIPSFSNSSDNHKSKLLPPETKTVQKSSETIDKIIIFYNNGSFKVYQ